MKKIFVSLCMLLVSYTNYGSSTQPFDSIVTLPYEPYFLPNDWQVLNTLNELSGTVFIDVSSKQGAAARYIAQASADGVAVYSINEWRGMSEFQRFLSNVIQEGRSDKVIPFRMSSADAADALNVTAQVIYLNASDRCTLFEDILRWFAHLSPNGKICGDYWNIHDIESAVVEAATELNLQVTVSGTFWTLQRVYY